MLFADRGYDADWIRELAAAKGAWANIPPKGNHDNPICFSPYLYRNASSARSNSAGEAQFAMTSSRQLPCIRPACVDLAVAPR
jgi:hypothetical protein